eukprot:7411941-Pyramimonas_sp.AAC.1
MLWNCSGPPNALALRRDPPTRSTRTPSWRIILMDLRAHALSYNRQFLPGYASRRLALSEACAVARAWLR